MTKDDVQKIQIDIESEGQSALSLMVCRDGTLARQGNGTMPASKIRVLGITDGAVFKELIEVLDERIFEQQGMFDHLNKLGTPVKYGVAFIGEEPDFRFFEFHIGLDNNDPGEVLLYINGLIQHAVKITDTWYVEKMAEKEASQIKKRVDSSTQKPWWKMW